MNTQARLALLAMLGLATPPQASELGRLFFSPIERAKLDQQARKEHTQDSRTDTTVTVNGIIKRSDGSRIAWINGKPHEVGANDNPNVVAVTVTGKRQAIDVTVGQRLILERALPPQPDDIVPQHKAAP